MYRKNNDRHSMSHSIFYKEDEPQHHLHPHNHLLHLQRHPELDVEGFNAMPGMEFTPMKEEPDCSDVQPTAAMHLINNEPQFIFEFPGQDEDTMHSSTTTLRHDSTSSPSFEIVPISASLSLQPPSSNPYNNNSNPNDTNDASASDPLLLDKPFASSSNLPLLRPGSPTTEAMRSMMSVFRVDPFASYDADAGSRKKRRKRGSSYAMLSDPEQSSKEERLSFAFQIQTIPGSEYHHVNYDLAASMLDSFSQTPSPSAPSSMDMRYHFHQQQQQQQQQDNNSSGDYGGAFLQSHDPQDLSNMILASDAAVLAEQASSSSSSLTAADTRFANLYTTYNPRQHTTTGFYNLSMTNNTFSPSHHPHLLHTSNPNPQVSSGNPNTNYMLQNMQQSMDLDLGMDMGMVHMGMNSLNMGLGGGSYPVSSSSPNLPSLESIASLPVPISMPAPSISMDNLSEASLPPMDSLSVSVSQRGNIIQVENQEDNLSSWSTAQLVAHSHSHSQLHTRHVGAKQNQGFGTSRHSLSRSNNEELGLPLALDFSRLHKIQSGISVQQDASKQMYQADQEREEEEERQGQSTGETGDSGNKTENLYLVDNNIDLCRMEDHSHDNKDDDENDKLELGERDRDSEVRDLTGGLGYPSPMAVPEGKYISERKSGLEEANEVIVSEPLTVSRGGDYDSEQDVVPTTFTSQQQSQWQTTTGTATATGTSSPTYPLYSARFDCDFDSVSVSEAVDDGELEMEVDGQRHGRIRELGRGHNGRVLGTRGRQYYGEDAKKNEAGNNNATARVARITPAPGDWTTGGDDGTLDPTPTLTNSEVGAVAESGFGPSAQGDRHEGRRRFEFRADETGPGMIITPSHCSSTSVSSPAPACTQSQYKHASQIKSPNATKSQTQHQASEFNPASTSHTISDYLNQYYENVNAGRTKINVEPAHADHSTQYYGGGVELAMTNQYAYRGLEYQETVSSSDVKAGAELSVAALHSSVSREDGAFMSAPSFTYSPSAASTSTSMTSLTNNTNAGSGSSTKMHTCWICHKEFPRPSGLATHMNTHSGLKPYKCPITSCSKTFAVRSNARRHLRIHGIVIRPGMNVLKSSVSGSIEDAVPGWDGCSASFESATKSHSEEERYNSHESFEFSQSPLTWRSLSLTPPLSLPEKAGRSLSPSFKHRSGSSTVSERQSKGRCGVYPYPYMEDTSRRHFPPPFPDPQVSSSPVPLVPHSSSHLVSFSSQDPLSYSYSDLGVSQSHMESLDGAFARQCVQGEFGLGTCGKIESPEPDGPFQLDSLCIPTRPHHNENARHSTPIPIKRGGRGLTPTRRSTSASTCMSGGAEGSASNIHTPTLSTVSTASTASSMSSTIDDSNSTAILHASFSFPNMPSSLDSYSAHTASTPTTTSGVGDSSLLPPSTRYTPTPTSMLKSSTSESVQARMPIPVFMPVAYHAF